MIVIVIDLEMHNNFIVELRSVNDTVGRGADRRQPYTYPQQEEHVRIWRVPFSSLINKIYDARGRLQRAQPVRMGGCVEVLTQTHSSFQHDHVQKHAYPNVCLCQWNQGATRRTVSGRFHIRDSPELHPLTESQAIRALTETGDRQCACLGVQGLVNGATNERDAVELGDDLPRAKPEGAFQICKQHGSDAN